MTDGVLLINLDAVPYPNLALMHISTWKKAQGFKALDQTPDLLSY